jgi:dTDP-4-dehydrorhamnose reductase
VTQALAALKAGQPFTASNDLVVSPTYVPDLVNVSLDLLIDRERGIWHLTNGEAVTWAELARIKIRVRALLHPLQTPAWLRLLNSHPAFSDYVRNCPRFLYKVYRPYISNA